MAQACPIASANAGELRYIERSAWAGVAQVGVPYAEEVGHTLAVFAAWRRVQHSLSELELFGWATPNQVSTLNEHIMGAGISRVERFLGRLGYYGSEGHDINDLVPVLRGQRIKGICFDKGYDTLALNTDEAVVTMHADNVPMAERKRDLLPGLVIISGSDVKSDASGDKLFDPLVVLPPLLPTSWRRIRRLETSTSLIGPSDARRAESWARLHYRAELLARIAGVGEFLERTGDNSNTADRARVISDLSGDVSELLGKPSLSSSNFVGRLGEESAACTGVLINIYDQTASTVAT